MTNAELLQEIRDRIERLRLEAKENCPEQTINRNYTPTQWQAIGEYNAYEIVGLFLSSLESEKPMNQKGLEREIERCLWKLSDDPSNEELRMFASHFAEWGAEHLANAHKTFTTTNGLEEAADNHIRKVVDAAGHPGWDWTTQDIADAFIAGAKWQKEQMMKEAVEGEVVKDWDNNLSVKSGVICGFKFGEKVRVIVLPKED